jgi:hypothetical protein
MLVDAGKYRSGGQMEFILGYIPEFTLPYVLDQVPQAHTQPVDESGQFTIQGLD